MPLIPKHGAFQKKIKKNGWAIRHAGLQFRKKKKREKTGPDRATLAHVHLLLLSNEKEIYRCTQHEKVFFLFFRKTTHPIHILYVCGALESLDLIRFEAKPRTYFDSLHIVTRWVFFCCVSNQKCAAAIEFPRK